MSDSRDQLQAALSERYTVERELGRGGMATVYLAHDLRHDRSVALKVLHPDLAATLGPERFQREIRLAARLQHPHILTVLDSGDAAGQLWFTMPFVEGESLRDRLRREKQLPVDEALRIAREAADALDYAHRHGVIHRDIKPENILLTEGHALVADFGIGKALGGASETQLTETGLTVGTPAYMSPEQAAGDKDLTARSDVYSLGIVLYEMLAGETPFAAPTAQAMIARRFMEVPKPVRELRDSVPEAAAQAVHRALARTAADRYATAAEFAQALHPGGSTAVATPAVAPTPGRGPGTAAPTVAVEQPRSPKSARRRIPSAAIMLGLGFLVGLGVLFAWRRSHGGAEAEDTGPKRVAVLPFENLGDSSAAYFADGITDEVRGRLSKLTGLAVIARASSNEYRRTSKPPQQIARELGADYLLTATVRWEKRPDGTSRVRVSPELVRVSPGAAPTTTWQEAFDAALTDVFQVQGDIAGKVASAMNVALGASQKETLTEKPTANLAAYDAFLKGEAASQGVGVTDPPSLRRGISFYEQAVALDSTFVHAWVQLARATAYYYYVGTATPAGAEASKRAADRAVALAAGRPETQLAQGDYEAYVLGEAAKARAAYEVGLQVAPANADLLTQSALAEQSLGRWEAALGHLERAQAVDPRSVNTARRLILTLIRLRRYPEALAAAERGLALAPTNLQLIENVALVHLAQGDLAGAQAVIQAAPKEVSPTALVAFLGNYWDLFWVLDDAQQRLLLRLTPSAFDEDRGTWAIVLAQTYWLRGDRAHARAYADSSRISLEEQLRATPDNGQQRVFLGLALAYLGKKADAIREGERGVALVPISRDGYTGPYFQHQLARIYLLVGEPGKALDLLEPLLKMPYHLSPGWLRVDPTLAPLRGNPRFEKLVAGG